MIQRETPCSLLVTDHRHTTDNTSLWTQSNTLWPKWGQPLNTNRNLVHLFTLTRFSHSPLGRPACDKVCKPAGNSSPCFASVSAYQGVVFTASSRIWTRLLQSRWNGSSLLSMTSRCARLQNYSGRTFKMKAFTSWRKDLGPRDACHHGYPLWETAQIRLCMPLHTQGWSFHNRKKGCEIYVKSDRPTNLHLVWLKGQFGCFFFPT